MTRMVIDLSGLTHEKRPLRVNIFFHPRDADYMVIKSLLTKLKAYQINLDQMKLFKPHCREHLNGFESYFFQSQLDSSTDATALNKVGPLRNRLAVSIQYSGTLCEFKLNFKGIWTTIFLNLV